MRKSLLLVLLFLSTIDGFAQEKTKRRAVYTELLGSAVIGSVNYDFRFKPGNDGLGMRMGFSYLPDVNHGSTFLTDFKDIGYIAFAKAGLRITPKNTGLFFNLNWTPLFNRDEIQWTWFGLGIGYSWNE
ncbi:hypothetical protein L3073_17360 [Ancylomarina sp. DW003]|nr:hypothetical protein [Ancylomarina sp. DW003]MDE5423986.1 hypothetical protein [Ancylomarina sp. DW003]